MTLNVTWVVCVEQSLMFNDKSDAFSYSFELSIRNFPAYVLVLKLILLPSLQWWNHWSLKRCPCNLYFILK